MSSKPPLTYRIAVFLLLPLWFFNALKISIKNRQIGYLLQRFSLSFPSLQTNSNPLKQTIWIHATSVGEVKTAVPLIEQLSDAYPTHSILLTTTTVTGASIVYSSFEKHVLHQYFPIDLPGVVERFIHKMNPQLAIILETELWPNLYHQLQRKKIPLIIINGRLSHKTTRSPRWFKAALRSCFKNLTHVYARSKADTKQFIALGMSKDKISTLGNLKFAPLTTTPSKRLFSFPYVLAASTRKDEELLIAQAWEKANKQAGSSDHCLVLVPRHPERCTSIKQKLTASGYQVFTHSKNEKPSSGGVIYLVDQIGVLPSLFEFATLTIMGGSFADCGGQNILEPARHGQAIITGPSMFNFQAEIDLFIAEKAILQLADASQLADQLAELMRKPQQREQLGARAKAAMQAHETIATQYLKAIATHLA